jgi:hypothetical protein
VSAVPVLYIHVRNEAQRAWAQRLIRPLRDRGIRVAAIRFVRVGPSEADLRYFHLADRNDAAKVGRSLRELGIEVLRLKQIANPDTQVASRQYEVWLPPSGYEIWMPATPDERP